MKRDDILHRQSIAMRGKQQRRKDLQTLQSYVDQLFGGASMNKDYICYLRCRTMDTEVETEKWGSLCGMKMHHISMRIYTNDLFT